MVLERFKILVDLLQITSGRIEKENILKEYINDDEIKQILNFIYNPYIITGISKLKVKRCKGFTEEQIYDHQYDPYEIIHYTNLEDLLRYFLIHNSGSDFDLIQLRRFANENYPYEELVYSIISKDIKTGVQPTTLNKIFGKDFIPTFDVMLAHKYFDDPDKLVPEGTEFILTTKLDGVRCVCVVDNDCNINFFSRQGQQFEGLVELEEEAKKLLPPGIVYDGELLLNKEGLESKDLYRETMKVVSADKEKHNVIFNCFDAVVLNDFKQGLDSRDAASRKDWWHRFYDAHKDRFKWFKEVEILYQGTDKSQIDYWLDKITSEGGEGVMINIANAPYECKRSKGLLKVKKMQTCDVRVVGLEEGTGQNRGKLGAMQIEFIGPDGKIYQNKVGSGLSKEQREDFWEHKEKLLDKIIEIKYFEISNNQNGTYGLRFPIFKWIREDKDEISMY